jgi:hypothetical protein
MSRILVSLALLLILSNAIAQQGKPVEFREEMFDFGTVSEEGGPVDHEFVFTNKSDRPVKILSVQASCGCTTPAWSQEPVAPGKTGFVQASYNPKGRPGYFNKTLSVTTDLEANPIVLQIKGQVGSTGPAEALNEFEAASGNWKLKNTSFNMGKVYHKDEWTVRDYQIVNAGSKVINYSGKFVGPAYIKVDVTPKTLAPGAKGNVKVSYNGKMKGKYGFQSDNIEIHTDDEVSPIKSFSVYATLEDFFPTMTKEELAKAPQIKLATTELDFGRINKGAATVREIPVTNNGKKELQIKSLQGNCTCVTASTTKSSIKPGESTTLKISFDPQQRSGTQQKAITVYSNDPQNPVIRILLAAYVN